MSTKKEISIPIILCPKCNSKLWSVRKYNAVSRKFTLSCDYCKYTEIKDWVFTNNNIDT